MANLYEILLDTARYSGICSSGVATTTPTGDNATLSLIDTARHEPDDYFKNGTVFIRSGDNEKLTRRITGNTNASGRIVFTPAVTGAIVAGVYYTVTNAKREQLVQAVQQALMQMGPYTDVYTDLTLVRNQDEYDLPAGVANLKRVAIGHGSGNIKVYNNNYHWQEMNGTLRFLSPLLVASGDVARIYYNKYHAEVNADADLINDNFDRQRLVWTSTYMYLLNRMQYSGNSDEKETLLLQNAMLRMDSLALHRPVFTIGRDPMLGRW